MQLAELVQASNAVARTAARLEKIARLVEALHALAPEERRAGASWLSGELAQGRIGLGPAAVRRALAATEPAGAATLSVAEVDAALDRIAAARGGGRGRRRAGRACAGLSGARPRGGAARRAREGPRLVPGRGAG